MFVGRYHGGGPGVEYDLEVGADQGIRVTATITVFADGAEICYSGEWRRTGHNAAVCVLGRYGKAVFRDGKQQGDGLSYGEMIRTMRWDSEEDCLFLGSIRLVRID